VLNNLYAQTQMQSVFGINMVALVDGEPRLVNLIEILDAFLRHRREVVTRRTLYLLRKAREKGHLLEGLAVALANIDDVIALIKSSPSAADAKAQLLERVWNSDSVLPMLEAAGADACKPDGLASHYGLHENGYHLSPEQAQAILELRLHRLTGLEQEKLVGDYQALLAQITDYADILESKTRLLSVVRDELEAIQAEYGDERKTEIMASQHDLTVEDLITEEDRVVTVSQTGYAKTQPVTDYRAQRRGGTGKAAASVKNEDVVEHLLVASTHDTLLCFSSVGKVYWLKVYLIPVASRTSRGKPLVNILPLNEGETITSILPLKNSENSAFVFMATRNGTVKKTSLSNFARPRSVGLRAIELDDDDRLIGTAITNGEQDILLASSNGKTIRFKESDVRAMGRTARGVRGIRLAADSSMVSLIIADEQKEVLTVSENGYGKRTKVSDFPVRGRGGQGVIGIQTSIRNGSVVESVQVSETDEFMLISDKGTLVRTRVAEVSVQGRNTQGVRLIRLKDGEKLVGLERVEEPSGLEDDDISETSTLDE
jgi:DNA gyrase subunit A